MERKRVVADMPLETYERLQTLAVKNHRSISSMITRLVALSTGEAEPEPFGTQVSMPTTDADREAMLERMR